MPETPVVSKAAGVALLQTYLIICRSFVNKPSGFDFIVLLIYQQSASFALLVSLHAREL